MRKPSNRFKRKLLRKFVAFSKQVGSTAYVLCYKNWTVGRPFHIDSKRVFAYDVYTGYSTTVGVVYDSDIETS